MLCQLLVAGGEGYIHPEIIHIEENPWGPSTKCSFVRASVSCLHCALATGMPQNPCYMFPRCKRYGSEILN
jgi:hypothetical protein